ncbi:alpha/beta hydrolase [Rhizobium sp. KVB221]|uniref:Alpha/beta hydrolase n=1 Tax=Rhizobium setariae TaxID=2801340 RepID=A0A937CJU0_9HYPH|nr:alpha/beta hydrolase [Rhizobium setariae]MBL0371465.1 alpha/beta hydrolase [Rhizobium setariae]
MSEAMTQLPDGTSLNVVDVGTGYPVIFQHGLGGDRHQVADSFPEPIACRRVTVECRGHGLSDKAAVERYSIAGFADDIIAAADSLGLQRFIVGGISMGAAIALRLAITRPERIAALMLVRPAWLTEPAPDNMRPFAEAATLLHTHGREGREIFASSPTGIRLATEAPDNLASLLGFFERDDLHALGDLLGAIALDGPGVTEEQVRALSIPALVVGHTHDLVHPWAYARQLAGIIPGARWAEITPKAVDKARYAADLRAVMDAFLRKFAASEETRT